MNVNDFAPGSPHGIQALASRIGETGSLAAQARNELGMIVSVCGEVPWHGKAKDGFSASVVDLPTDLIRMSDSYSSVSAALRSYGGELEDVRAKVSQAIARYEVAQTRKAQAEGEVSRAAARLRQLQGQLIAAKTDEHRAKGLYAAATLVPGSDAGLYQQYLQARSWRVRLESDYASTIQIRNRHQGSASSAQLEMQAESTRLADLKEQREQAESLCAQRINDALAAELRNRSWLEKNILDPLVGMAKAALSGDELRFVFHLRQFIEGVSTALKFVGIAVAVIGLIAVAVAAIALGPVAGLMVAFLVAKISYGINKVGKVLAAAKVATGVVLYSSGYKNPETGKRAVTEVDLVLDSGGLAAAHIGKMRGKAAVSTLGTTRVGANFEYDEMWHILARQTTAEDIAMDHVDIAFNVSRGPLNEAVSHLGESSRKTYKSGFEHNWDQRRTTAGMCFVR